MRHRLEYLGVRVLIALVRVMPGTLVDRSGALLGLAVYLFDRTASPHRRARMSRPRSRPLRRANGGDIVRGAFAHFGRLLFELLKFSTLSPEAMLARVEFEGEDRVRPAHAQGKGVLFVTGHFGYLGAAGDGARAAAAADGGAGARARQPAR